MFLMRKGDFCNLLRNILLPMECSVNVNMIERSEQIIGGKLTKHKN